MIRNRFVVIDLVPNGQPPFVEYDVKLISRHATRWGATRRATKEDGALVVSSAWYYEHLIDGITDEEYA